MGYAIAIIYAKNEKQPLSVRVLQDELNCCEQEISQHENTIRTSLAEEIKASAFGQLIKVKMVNNCK